MKIDLDWSADGNVRASIWSASGEELGRIECGSGGYRAVIGDGAGPWLDRMYEAIAGFRQGCNRYTLTVEEFLAWQYAIDRNGLAGLRATRIQQYRHAASRWLQQYLGSRDQNDR